MKQKKCCSLCNGHYDALQLPENKLGQTEQKKKIRLLSAAQASKLYEDIDKIILHYESEKYTHSYNSIYCEPKLPSAAIIMEGIEYMYDETVLLSDYAICDELLAQQLISVINTYN